MDRKQTVQNLYTKLIATIARERVLKVLGGKAEEDEIIREMEKIEMSSYKDKNLFWLNGRILFIIPSFEVFSVEFIDKITDDLNGVELNFVQLTTEVECFVFAEDKE